MRSKSELPLIRVYVPSGVLELSPSRLATPKPPNETKAPLTVNVLRGSNAKLAPESKTMLLPIVPEPPSTAADRIDTVPVASEPLTSSTPSDTVVPWV